MDNQGYISDTYDTPANEKNSKYGTVPIDDLSPELAATHFFSKSTFAQYLATFINSLSTVTLGLLYMIPTIVIGSVSNAKEGLSLNDEQVSWYASFLPIFQPLGCCLGGFLQRYIGRVQGLVLMNASTIISWILLYKSYSPSMLYMSSILMGVSIGFVEAPAITYIAEISTPSLRGFLTTYSVSKCSIGMVLAFVLALFMNWRTLCIYGIGLCVLTVILLAFIPDSPVWLINKGQEEKALKALRWLRGWVSESHVQEEFENLCQQIQNSGDERFDEENGFSWRQKLRINDLLDASTLRPFFFVITFYFLAAAAAIVGARNYYLVLFDKLDIPFDHNKLVLVSLIASMLGNLSSCLLVKTYGKRRVTLTSIFLSSSLAVLIGLYIVFQYELKQPWIFAVLIVSMGLAPHLGGVILPWILLGEIFPLRVRNAATGIAGALFYIIIFIYTKTYYYLELLLTTQGVFILYGVLGFVGFFYLLIFMPETEGKTLAEIEELFTRDSRKKCKHFRKKK